MNFRLVQQALAALEMYREHTPEGNGVAEQAIKALKQFKKEWVETEVPYVVVECNCSGKTTIYSPPKRTWVGLTDDEKEKFVVAYYPSNWDRKTAVALMNNYEAYLKEKNT